MKLPAAAYSAEVATSATKAGSCGVSCEILRPVGQSLWAACRSHYPPSPRLRRVLLAFIPAARYGVCGEGESRLVPEYPHGEARYSGQLGACPIPDISEASKGWRHCASVLASAPHLSIVRVTSQDSRPQNRSMLGLNSNYGMATQAGDKAHVL
jgi:hypothetical protein